jgi:osmoprotectant transport system substrate-binding protein
VRTRWLQGALAALMLLSLALGAAACGSDDNGTSSSGDQPGKGKPAVTIGSKDFTEQFILGQLYTQALEAKGYKVTFKQNIGSTEVTDKALTSGKIDMYPEYTGTILSVVAGRTSRPASEQGAYDAAKKFQQSRGFTLLNKTPYFNSDAVGVTKAYAQQNGLKSIADIKKLGAKFTWGAPPESRNRFEGLKGLQQVYGLTAMKFKPLQIGLQYKALDSGDIQGGDVFTTDGQLSGGKYIVLADPKKVFGFQNVAPVVKDSVLQKEGPAFAQTLNAVSAKLTLEAIRKMNAAVDIDKQDPADVASQFLQANGLKGK